MPRPNYASRLVQRAQQAFRQGNFVELERRCEQILKAEPRNPDATRLLGQIKLQRGDNQKALKLLEIAATVTPPASPAMADIFLSLGKAQLYAGRQEDAIQSYDKAVELAPKLFATWYNRGNALVDLGRQEDAIDSYRRALALNPNHIEANYNLGHALIKINRDMAIAAFERVLALDPTHSDARFARCMSEIRVIYEDEAEITKCRAAYSAQLDKLTTNTEGLTIPALPPFYLTYQGCNDRDLQGRLGNLICGLMAKFNPPPDQLATPPASNEPIRVGIVTGYFYLHSVWKIPVKGWLSKLDRQRFRVFGYHTSDGADTETEIARSLCERFIQKPMSLDGWCREILSDRPHVLIYPDIGMDQTATQLASLRLAPVQCVSLGHPTTSGYPTIDYYLSSDRMEPVDGAQHYTEQLVRLPNLSIYYEPREVRSPTMNRQEIGLRSDACVYWCGQSWFKYLPQYDHVFAAIAKEVTGSQFLFIRPRLVGPEPLAKFEKRIERSFAGHGLKAHDHCVFIDAMEPHRFDAIFGLSDIFLDSIGWSGNNTTMESLVHNLPIVTMTAPLMRGRHTLAIVQQMGVHELIADTVEQYVNTAVRLALDTRWRTNIKARIAERKHNVYRDQSTVRALEGFLERVVRGAGLS